jgi:ABC-2 type transport system ATP-binding protein
MQPIIAISKLTKTYGSGLQALKPIDLDIRRGEIFALLGPNGAGKTTLISIVCGIVTPTSGSVLAAGHDIVRDYRAARARIGLVPQELHTDMFETVWNTVGFSRGLFGCAPDPAYLEKVLRDLSLWEKRHDKIMMLSGGMKRRVLIAKALAHEPEILFLDEPTAGVDVELRQTLWKFVRQLNRDGHTIVLTTHYLEEAEALCGRIAMLKQGQLVALDTTQNLLRKHSGCYVELRLDPDVLPAGLEALVVERREDGAWRLALADYVEVENVMAQLREARVRVHEMEVMQPDLEEVFVQIMQKA